MKFIYGLILFVLLYFIFKKKKFFKENYTNEINQDQVNDLNLQIIDFIKKIDSKEYSKSKLLSEYKLINNVLEKYIYISSSNTYIQEQINELNSIWNTKVTPFI